MYLYTEIHTGHGPPVPTMPPAFLKQPQHSRFAHFEKQFGELLQIWPNLTKYDQTTLTSTPKEDQNRSFNNKFVALPCVVWKAIWGQFLAKFHNLIKYNGLRNLTNPEKNGRTVSNRAS